MELLNPPTPRGGGGHDHLSLHRVQGILYQHNGFRGEYLRVVEATAVAKAGR